MPDLSPFERVFNPPSPGDNPSLFGAIGGLFGNQSNAERQSKANAEAIGILTNDVSQGATPQEALVNFMKTPQGIDLMARGGIKDLGLQFKQALEVTPTVSSIGPGQTPVINTPGKPPQIAAQPTMTTEQATARTVPPTIGASPGQSVLEGQPGPDGRLSFKPIYQQPTTAVQDFSSYAALSKLPPDQIQALAGLQATPPDQRPTAIKRFFDQAVKNGSFSQEVADKLQADFYKEAIAITPLLNRVGEPIGNTLIDKSNPGNPRSFFLPNSTGGVPGADQPPGVTPPPPGSPAAATQPAGTPTVGTDKRTMFFGSGVLPSLMNITGQIVRNFDPHLQIGSAETANEGARMLSFLQNSVVQLSRTGAGLSVPTKVIGMAQNLAPGSSVWEDPRTAINHAVDLHVNMTQQIKDDTAKLNDPQISKTQKHDAEKRIAAYQDVLSNLPELGQMTDLQRRFSDPNDPLVKQLLITPSKAINDTLTMGRGAASSGQKQMDEIKYPPGSQSDAAAQAAKKGAGANRFEALSDDNLMKVDERTLNPAQQSQLLSEIDRRRALNAQKRQQKGAK